ncbi:hypothetical protein LCGC14_1064210 [marine sediment metagenome]|uniref:Uncharacterized protein n=1 Tax=marine sediment metagenome TaxID=412755 RepID=A0A0F9N740_9ZZZZ
MAIIFGGDSGVKQSSFSGFVEAISGAWNRFTQDLSAAVHGNIEIQQPPLEKVFVDDGFSNVPGTSFVDSTVDNVDDIQTRRIATQEPSLILRSALFGDLVLQMTQGLWIPAINFLCVLQRYCLRENVVKLLPTRH